jgi:ATP-dependent helicase Lhr and Lhr-like helicase
MMERIVAGAEPACRLSRRAQAALADIRLRLPFIDTEKLPIVSSGIGRIVIWAFAGGAATASIAAGLIAQGLQVAHFDDVAITLRSKDLDRVAKSLRNIDPVSIHPILPTDLVATLKFGLCLPASVLADVLRLRTADRASVEATCRRDFALISAPD